MAPVLSPQKRPQDHPPRRCGPRRVKNRPSKPPGNAARPTRPPAEQLAAPKRRSPAAECPSLPRRPWSSASIGRSSSLSASTARTGSSSRQTPAGHSHTATFSGGGFAPAREKAGLPEHVTFDDLRHAFASRAAHRGVPVNVLSEILGHSHVGVTQKVYLHLYDDDASGADGLLPRLRPPSV